MLGMLDNHWAVQYQGLLLTGQGREGGCGNAPRHRPGARAGRGGRQHASGMSSLIGVADV